jgi:hypothetical protein
MNVSGASSHGGDLEQQAGLMVSKASLYYWLTVHKNEVKTCFGKAQREATTNGPMSCLIVRNIHLLSDGWFKNE